MKYGLYSLLIAVLIRFLDFLTVKEARHSIILLHDIFVR